MIRFQSVPGADRCASLRALIVLLSMVGADTIRADDQETCLSAVLTLAEAAELLRVDANELERQAERGEVPARRLGSAWRFNCASLLSWLNGDWERTGRLFASAADASRAITAPPAGSQLDETGLARVTGTGTTDPESGPGPDERSSTPAQSEATPIGEAPEERTAEDILLRNQRVLLGRGQSVLDFGQFYSEGNALSLASFDGSAVLSTVEQETLFTLLQGRIGLGVDSELFVGSTYFNRDSDAFFGSEKIASAAESAFGSVNLGVRRTLKREGPGRPDIIGTLSTNIPTGDTSYALGGGLAFVKTIDPVVLFASINYTHTFVEDFTDVTLLEPEDRIDVGFGYALALNDTLALSMSLAGTFTGATRSGSAELRQQDTYGVRFGLTSWLAPGVYIEPSVTFNLGGPEDSFVLGLTVPYTLGRRSRIRE